MKVITYEIECWVEVRFQRANFDHGDRWYVTNSLKSSDPLCDYLTESGHWDSSHPKFFDTPEGAEAFWNTCPAKELR
jgi:hypothetical protein